MMATIQQDVLDAISKAEDSIEAANASDVVKASAQQALVAANTDQLAKHQQSAADSADALAKVKALLGVVEPA